jgi:hypothetical protein
MDRGWIKVYRKITEWEWYQDANTFRVFFHLLITANHSSQKWRGIVVGRGQLITSRKALCGSLALTERQVRTALTHLESTNEITIETTNKYSLITIVNYDKYQGTDNAEDQQSDNQATNRRPSNGQHSTTNNNDKNVNNDNDKNKKQRSSLLTASCEHWYAPEEEPYKECKWLIDQIKSIHPNAMLPDLDSDSFQKWCDTLRIMHECDKREWADFKALVEFMRGDDFWSIHLLTADAVRKHWDKAWAQYQRTRRSANGEQEWENVLLAIRRFGRNRKADAMNSLSPRAAKIINDLGWLELCNTTNLGLYRARFLKSWRITASS